MMKPQKTSEGLSLLLECSARRSEEHTSELQSPCNLVCRLLLEKKKQEETVAQTTCEGRACSRRVKSSCPLRTVVQVWRVALRVRTQSAPGCAARGESFTSLYYV